MSIEARESRANLPGIVAAMFSNATVDRDYAPYGLFLLRISLGFDWLVHAFLKVSRGMYTHEALLAKNGITPLLAWPTFSLEVIGGAAILLGFFLGGGRALYRMARGKPVSSVYEEEFIRIDLRDDLAESGAVVDSPNPKR